mgnify:CR=1 FL=1
MKGLKPEDVQASPCSGYCQRVIAIEGGRIASHGPTEEVLKPELVRRIFSVEAAYREDPLTNRLRLVPYMLLGHKNTHSTNGATPVGAEAHLPEVVDEKSPH